MQIARELATEAARAEIWVPWALRGVRVIVILGGACVLTAVTRRLFRKLQSYTVLVMDRRGDGSTIEMEKRAATLIAVITKVTNLTIWMLAVVMSLTELTFHIEPLLAGLGVAGLALGLGAQTLIKDWLGGFFLMLEDQLRIGDSVSINGISGGVEEINLRTVLLRGENGAVHVIANGSINTLSNFTRDYSYYVFEATLAHGSDVDRALEILESTGKELAAEDQFRAVILAPIEVMGIDRLAERGVTIKGRIKTLPSMQAMVGRELNRRMKARLEAEKIAFPTMLPPTPEPPRTSK
jgi:moderate conductance mechanosensitive channel